MYRKAPSLLKCIKSNVDSWLNPRVYTEEKYLKFVSGFKYQINEDFIIFIEDYKPSKDIIDEFFEFYTDGTLLIKRGFAWDGPSGPTIDTKDSHIAAIVHDVFYRCIRKGYLPLSVKPIADKIFYKLLRKNGMFILRAYRWYLGVKLFGKKSCTAPIRTIEIARKFS